MSSSNGDPYRTAVVEGFWRIASGFPGAKRNSAGPLEVISSKIPTSPGNVIFFDSARNSTEDRLGVLYRWQRRIHPMHSVYLAGDSAAMNGSEVIALTHGYRVHHVPGMLYDSDKIPAYDSRFGIRVVAIPKGDLESWRDVHGRIFGVPGWSRLAMMPELPRGATLLAAYDRASPIEPSPIVGVAMVSVVGDVAYLSELGVLRSYRHQGIGRALVSEAIGIGIEFGASSSYLLSTKKGRRLYDAIGFKHHEWYAVCDAKVGFFDRIRYGREFRELCVA